METKINVKTYGIGKISDTVMTLVASMLMLVALFIAAPKADAATLIPTTDTQLQERIAADSTDHRYKIFFFFTSWCSTCKNTMNKLVDIRNNSNVKIYDISIDQNYNDVLNFANSMDRDVNIYHMASGNQINAFFNYYGITYRDKVPHLVLLGRDNQIVGDGWTLNSIINHLNSKDAL